MKTKCLLILCPITVHVYKYGQSLAQNRTHAYKTQKNNNEFELSTQEDQNYFSLVQEYKNRRILSMWDHERLLLWQCTALIFIRTVNKPPPLMQNIHHRCCAEEYVPLPLGEIYRALIWFNRFIMILFGDFRHRRTCKVLFRPNHLCTIVKKKSIIEVNITFEMDRYWLLYLFSCIVDGHNILHLLLTGSTLLYRDIKHH